MTNNKTNYHGDEEVIQRNVERSREVIEARKQGHDDEQLDDVNPRDLDTEVQEFPPGQTNTPIGGQSNMNFNGGTAHRKKTG